MLLQELLEGLGQAGLAPRVQGPTQVSIADLQIDSRLVGPGHLFVALEGAAADGHRFVGKALAQGAVAVLANEGRQVEAPGATVVFVPDTRAALGHLAATFFGHPGRSLSVLGLTGTNGKTTTSYILEAIAQAAGRQVGVIGTINQRFAGQVFTGPNTTPSALEVHRLLRKMVDAGVDTAVMEVSSHALVTHRVVGVPFVLGAFLNLSQDHLNFHGTMEAYLEAKARLLTGVLPWSAAHLDQPPVALVHTGDEAGARLWPRVPEGLRARSFDGRAQPAEADFTVSQVSLEAQGTSFCLHGPGLPPEGLALRSWLLGAPNLENLVTACSAALSLGWPAKAVQEGVASLRGVPGRLESVPGPEGAPAVVVDYAHTPRAVEVAAESLRALTQRGRLITVLGCGGDRDRDKRAPMGLAAALRSDLVVVTSDNPRREAPQDITAQVVQGALEAPGAQLWPQGWGRWFSLDPRPDTGSLERGPLVMEEVSRRRAIAAAVSLARPGDTVLIAGKGHEDYQEVCGVRYHLSDREEAHEALRGRLAVELLSVEELAALCGAQLLGAVPGAWRGHNAGIVTDSRQVKPGAVFVALRGERFDAHDFLGGVVQAGAVAVVVAGEAGREAAARAWEGVDSPGATLVVEDTLEALGSLARGVLEEVRRCRPWMQTVALTGSNGKTTTKELIAALLVDLVGLAPEAVHKTPGNYNNLVGVPLTVFGMPLATDAVVLEHGANAVGEVAQMVEMSRAEVRLLTSLSEAHLGGFGSREKILEAKQEIFGGSHRARVGILPGAVAREADPEKLKSILTCVSWRRGERPWVNETEKEVLFGTGEAVEWWPEPEEGVVGLRWERVDKGSAGDRLAAASQEYRVQMPLLGEHNAANLSLALVAAGHVGLALGWRPGGEPQRVKLRSLRLPSGRLALEEGAGCPGVLVLNDTYNANPGSMLAGLGVLMGQARRRGGRAVAVLGDMFELGPEGPALHRELGRQAVAAGAAAVVAFGALSVELARGAREAAREQGAAIPVESFGEHSEEAALCAARWLRAWLKERDVVLIKGSRGVRMERIVEALLTPGGGD